MMKSYQWISDDKWLSVRDQYLAYKSEALSKILTIVFCDSFLQYFWFVVMDYVVILGLYLICQAYCDDNMRMPLFI